VVPGTTMKLNPGAILRNVVPIGDRAHGWKNTVCPRKIEHLGGKVRAILYFAYQSEENYEQRDPKGRVDVVSNSVALPVAK
jgi:hypothetical protein